MQETYCRYVSVGVQPGQCWTCAGFVVDTSTYSSMNFYTKLWLGGCLSAHMYDHQVSVDAFVHVREFTYLIYTYIYPPVIIFHIYIYIHIESYTLQSQSSCNKPPSRSLFSKHRLNGSLGQGESLMSAANIFLGQTETRRWSGAPSTARWRAAGWFLGQR